MSDFKHYMLMQIASDVRAIKDHLEAVTTWGQRIGIVIVLWIVGLVANLTPDRAGEIVAAAVRALK